MSYERDVSIAGRCCQRSHSSLIRYGSVLSAEKNSAFVTLFYPSTSSSPNTALARSTVWRRRHHLGLYGLGKRVTCPHSVFVDSDRATSHSSSSVMTPSPSTSKSENSQDCCRFRPPRSVKDRARAYSLKSSMPSPFQSKVRNRCWASWTGSFDWWKSTAQSL